MLLCCTACNNNGSQVQNPNDTIPTVQPDTTNSKSTTEFEARIQARFAAGDTLLTDHKRLANVLPDTIPSYKLELNSSDKFGSDLFTFSEASKVFYNENEDYIELTLGDYVQNPDFFRVNIRRYNLAQGVEISGVKDEKRTLESLKPTGARDFFTWSSLNSRKRLAWVFIGVDERYFLTIEATGKTEFLNLEVVKEWLNWGALY